MKKGIKALRRLLETIKGCTIEFIYKLSKDVMDGSLFFTLIGTFEDDSIWVINSGASRHMTRKCSQLQTLSKGISSHSIELGDKNRYSVRGIGFTSLELETGGNIHLDNILYVPNLKKYLLYISYVEDKGGRVAFVDGKVIVWGKGSSI